MFITMTMRMYPKTSPRTVEMTMKEPILMNPDGIMDSQPALTTAAPAKPPIKAWEELVGRPEYQVKRSQAIAPMSAAKITVGSTTPGWMTPLPIVVATFTPKPKAATKLKNAAQSTASCGVKTRVDTTVAIELAESRSEEH